MKTFGHFDDEHREYVITDPATPFPWINYLGNEDFFGLISNTAGGYDFYKSSAASHVTATTAFPWMPVVATSISMTVVPFGTLVGSPARLSLTATSAVMA